MIVKKLIETKTEGEYEILKYHKIEVNDITQTEINELTEEFSDDDYEDQYNAGIFNDLNGDIYLIDVDKFIEAFENREKFDEDDNVLPKSENSIINKLKKYTGYELIL